MEENMSIFLRQTTKKDDDPEEEFEWTIPDIPDINFKEIEKKLKKKSTLNDIVQKVIKK